HFGRRHRVLGGATAFWTPRRGRFDVLRRVGRAGGGLCRWGVVPLRSAAGHPCRWWVEWSGAGPSTAEGCVVRPPLRRTLSSAAKTTISPRNVAFDVQGAASLSVRRPGSRIT